VSVHSAAMLRLDVRPSCYWGGSTSLSKSLAGAANGFEARKAMRPYVGNESMLVTLMLFSLATGVYPRFKL